MAMENNPTIEASLTEVDTGIFYQVKLHAIPHVGELIDLWSFVEQVANNNAIKRYSVVQVVHKVYDVTDKVPRGMLGSHYVNIFVKESSHPLFENT
jgi:hypothetical protein